MKRGEKREGDAPTHFRLAATNRILELVVKLRRPHQRLRQRGRAAHLKLLEGRIVGAAVQILRLQNHAVAVEHERLQPHPAAPRTASRIVLAQHSSPNLEGRNSAPSAAIQERNRRCGGPLQRACRGGGQRGRRRRCKGGARVQAPNTNARHRHGSLVVRNRCPSPS